jgi:hypothetical protein
VLDIQKNKGSANSPENVNQRKEHTDGGDNGNKCHEHPSVILPFALRTCHLPFLICRNPKSRSTIQAKSRYPPAQIPI